MWLKLDIYICTDFGQPLFDAYSVFQSLNFIVDNTDKQHILINRSN